MAAATAAREDFRQDGVLTLYPTVATTTIYKGTVVSVNAAGYAKPAAATDKRVVGIAYETVTGGATAGAKTIRVWQQGTFELNGAGLAQTNVGDKVYVTDDNTVTLTGAGTIQIGVITEFVSATKVRVALTPNV